MALADRCVERTTELRMAVHSLRAAHASSTRRQRPGRPRRGSCAGRVMHGRPRARPVRTSHDRRRHVARCAGLDRHPAESCMASQYAGWAIDPEGFFAMGSGPLRAKARVERELFGKLGYAEDAARGVLVLESRSLPTDESRHGWRARQTSACCADLRRRTDGKSRRRRADRGTVIETGLHKMDTVGFDVRRVLSAWAPRLSHRPRGPTSAPSAARTTAFFTGSGPLYRAGGRRRAGAACHAPSGVGFERLRTRSTTSSNATTTTSTRSTDALQPCRSVAHQRDQRRTFHGGRSGHHTAASESVDLRPLSNVWQAFSCDVDRERGPTRPHAYICLCVTH